MSANTSKDVSLIQDEDVLRKMWQDTEDFGRKKEIRSHMYKLREQRLREFYNSGDNSTTEIRTTTTTGKSCDTPTHADSLADHSFLSLKSKEIRDSESPTRDVSYKITGKHNDQGWQIVSSNETSSDGKSHTASQLATKSGTQKIDGGKIDYAAKNEQIASVYADGDDKNFTKSVGAKSNTMIKQDAVGGDENSNFKVSSTKTSSSSRVVTESKSSSGDDFQQVPPSKDQTSTLVSRKVYTNDAPVEIKNHPSFVEGKTQVIRETKTLPDGTIVTTTRYETRGETTAKSTSKFSSNVQDAREQVSTSRSSRTHQSSTVSDQHQKTDNTRAIEYITDSQGRPDYPNQVVHRVNQDTKVINEDYDQRDTRNQKVNTEHHHSQVIKQHYDNRNANETNKTVIKSYVDNRDKGDENFTDTHTERNVSITRDNKDDKRIVKKEQVEQITKTRKEQIHDDFVDKNVNSHLETVNREITREIPVEDTDSKYTTTRIITTRNEPSSNTSHTTTTTNRIVRDESHEVPVDNNETKYTTTKIITTRNEPSRNISHTTTSRIVRDDSHEIPVENNETKYTTTRIVTTRSEPTEKVHVIRNVEDVNDQFINIERQQEKHTRKVEEYVPKKEPLQSSRKPDDSTGDHPQPQPYHQPDKRQPIKPGKSELDRPTKPTTGQYETTYNTDYQNRKISVEVSPTHDAFARSLRAVTPDRTSKCSSPSRGSTRSLRSSNPSLRSSTSPEKVRQPQGPSPDRHLRGSPRKSADRFSSNETITYLSNRRSPEKPSTKKSSSPQRILNKDTIEDEKTTTDRYNTDTITRRKKIVTNETRKEDDIDTSTITRRRNRSRSRSPSPVSTVASEIEYIRNYNDVVTDLDEENVTNTTITRRNTTNIYETTKNDTRPTSLEITTKKSKKVTERSPTSPLIDLVSPSKKSPTKEVPRKSSLRSPSSDKSPKHVAPEDRLLKRTDTYEERCRQILGLTDTTEKRRGSLERTTIKRGSFTKDTVTDVTRRTPTSPEKPSAKSPEKESPPRGKPLYETPGQRNKSPVKNGLDKSPAQVRKSPVKEPLDAFPGKKSPVKDTNKIAEFPSQVRRSPTKEPLEPYPEKKSPTKASPKIAEFPSQVRRSPVKEPLEPYPEKRSPTKDSSKVAEFPSQVRRSPEKKPLEPYPERKSPVKDSPKVAEFPSQIRRSPEKESLEPYPERKSPTKVLPKVAEFPSQIRRSPEKEPLEPYPEKQRPTKDAPKIAEFPSQIRKSPEKEPFEPYPERKIPIKDYRKVAEFPSQVKRSPEKESLEPYPEKQRPTKESSKVAEFPSQVRRSPEKEPLEPYPEKQRPTKDAPKIDEFPSQVRRSPEKEPLEPYPERKSPTKEHSKVAEFPSQIRRSPEKEPLEPYPEKQRPTKNAPKVAEFPSQVRRSPEKEPLEPYPEKQRPAKDEPQVAEFPSQVRRSPEKEPLEPYPEKQRPNKDALKVAEFPSQVRRSPEKEPLEPYPEKQRPAKDEPKVAEFPSQVRRSPEKEPLEPYPEKQRPNKDAPKIGEFPSQVRRSPEKEPLEPYPEKQRPVKDAPKVAEFPSLVRRSPEKESLEPYPEKQRPNKDAPKIGEFPSQVRRFPEKEPLEPYPEKQRPVKDAPKVAEFPSQVRRSPEKEPLEPYPEKQRPIKELPKVAEFPSQIRRLPEKEPLEPHPERKTPIKNVPKIDEFPSQVKRSPEKELLEPYPEKQRPTKAAPKIAEFPSQVRKSPEKEQLEPYPEKQKPIRDSQVPSHIEKVRPQPHPTYAAKKPQPKDKKPIDQYPSSSSEDEEEIEETFTETSTTYLENRIPASEPEITKKFITQLCREEEIERTGIVEHTTEEDIEVELSKTQKRAPKKEQPRKPAPKTNTEEFIKKERNVTSVTTTDKKSPTKKPVPEKQPVTSTTTKVTKDTTKAPLRKQQEIHKIEKTKFINQSEYTDQYQRSRPKQPKVQKSTLIDVENLSETEEDRTVHRRTHRVDDTVNKKTTTTRIMVNGDVGKKPKPKEVNKPSSTVTTRSTVKTTYTSQTSPGKKPLQPKLDEPKSTQPRYITTAKKFISVAEPTKPKQVSPKTPTTKVTDVTKNKTTKLEQITTKSTKQEPVTSKPNKLNQPKKHLVITTVPVTSKDKPAPVKQTTKSTSTKTTRVSGVTQSPKKLHNGHISSDTEDESIADSLEDSTFELNQTVTHTVNKKTHEITGDELSKTIYKTINNKTAPVKTTTNRKPEKRCITTKTVIINKDIGDREVIVDLQRSKSSREPTPDRLCPIPLSSDDEPSGVPRYPDEVLEPEDGFHRTPKRLSDIPLMETDDHPEFSRITEVSDTQKVRDFVTIERTDDTSIGYNKKILRDTTQKVTTRPKTDIPEDLQTDECLLSVSDKVSKFITTAEQLITPQQLADRPKSPICRNYPEEVTTSKISDRITHFSNTSKPVDQLAKPSQGPAPKVPRPVLTDVDEVMKDDDCMLSVSDKVSKFVSTADKLTKTEIKKPISLAKIDVKPKTESEPRLKPKTESEPKYPERKSPERKSPERKYISASPQRQSPSRAVPTDCVTIETEEHTFTRKSSLSPERKSPSPDEKTPNRRPSNKHPTIKTETQDKYPRRDSSPKYIDTTPKSGRRPSQEESKIVLSSAGRLRSTESIKRAKALFENINKEQETLKQRDILSRPSVFEGRKSKTPNMPKKRLSYSDEDETEVTTHTTRKTFTSEREKLQSTKLVLDKIRSRTKSPEYERRKSPEKSTESKDSSPDRGDIPHYMLPLDRSLRQNSPHRDSVTPSLPVSHPPSPDHSEVKTTKFGVTLKRTDSGRTAPTTTTTNETRKSSIVTEKRITEEEIDDIFDLEVLEELLIRVVGYELRRKIRVQIRLVKKLISENTLTSYIAKRKFIPRDTKREPNKAKPSEGVPKHDYKKTSEYQTQYTRKTSPQRISVDNKTYQRTDHVDTRDEVTEYTSSHYYSDRRSSSEYATEVIRRSHSPESKPKSARSSPERKPTSKTETFTKLKKTQQPVTKTIEDDKPEWVKQRNLRKASENSTPVGKKTTTKNTTTTTTTRRASPAKEVKPTDLITSSYGVGPTDENGAPLFGLKALRAQNKTATTKVQGTVITSEFHSETGKEPVGQVSVTKYSTDPRDLGTDEHIVNNQDIKSVTTTQKFGYKDTPSLRVLTSKQKKITNDDESTVTTKSSKVTRKNSVKALSQKFIENAVETLKSERQTSYPKAGLILRTSSFKDSGSGSDDDDGGTSPAERECESVTVRTTSSKTVSGDTFLTNKSRVTGVKDVIRRMKTEEYQTGDSEEDVKARDLLNKFIGSQVILSGMESKTSSTTTSDTVSVSPSSTVKRTTKITTTVTEGGKPITKTRVFERPITQEELDTIWDEQTLRLLLDQSTDYEERRVIRARLRQVMAEQEACTELVEKASQEQSSGAIEGESLLLPLLQGLLEAPENEQLADSGTESGEDQRSGLIAEVQNALDKLSASLRNDATDITTERRSSLLQLVTKLQAGLATTTPKLERRLSSGPGRFSKKRDRQSRHTVGVSSEELADARRLMEEISLRDLTPSHSKHKLTNLQKQNSESSVNSSSSSFTKFGSKVAVKNATPKPFNSSSNSLSSSVQTPDASEHLELLFGEETTYHDPAPIRVLDKKSSCAVITSADQNDTDNTPALPKAPELPLIDIDHIKSVHQAVQAAARKKLNSESVESETEEEESSTVKEQTSGEPVVEKTPSPLQENPIYNKPEEKTESPGLSYAEKVSRFDTQSKKLKMKRANTIDIPKSLQFYEDEDDESESEIEDGAQKRKSNYYALRGPIRVGNPVNKSTVPVFEPKTRSDQKFVQFINKNNQDSDNKSSMWAYQNNKTPVWGNKFGNIKNTFERSTSTNEKNSARNFWKTQDDATLGGLSQQGPKISRRSARNLQQMFEEKQRQSLERTKDATNVVTGSLTLKTEPEKTYKFVPQHLPLNKFSHAPQSAFKPITKKIPETPDTLAVEPKVEIIKTELKEKSSDAPVFLYSPKPVFNSQNNSTTTSPVASKPWIVNATEHGGRVLSIAAKKFESPQQIDTFPVQPRKLSREYTKVFAPQPPPEKLVPYPYRGTGSKSNTVRKLSAEYDTLGNKIPEYTSQSSVKYQPAQEKKYQYVPQYKMPQSMNFTSAPKESQHSSYKKVPQLPQKSSEYHNTYYQQYPSKNQEPEPQHLYQKISQQTRAVGKPIPKPNQEFQPVNYSIRYDQPRLPLEPAAKAAPQSQQIYKHVPGKVSEPPTPDQEFVSSVQFNIKPKQQKASVPVQIIEPISQPPKLQTQTSTESLHEYTAISSKVMSGPVSQQAVTVRQKSPMSRDEHDMEKAFSLKNSLQQVTRTDSTSPSGSFKYKSPTALSPNNSMKCKSADTDSVPHKSQSPDIPKQFVSHSQHETTQTQSQDIPKHLVSNNKYESTQPHSQDIPKHLVSHNKYETTQTQSQDAPKHLVSHNKYESTQPRSQDVPKHLVSHNKYESTQPRSQDVPKHLVSHNKYESTQPRSQDVPKHLVSRNKYESTQQIFRNRTSAPQQHEHKTFGVVKPMQQKPTPIYNNVSGIRKLESLEMNDKGQSVVTSKFHIPLINVAPSSPSAIPTHAQVLSKSDSWHQICMANQAPSKPSPRSSPVGRGGVSRSKSSHSLAVPQKQFEAGMSKEELVQKKKTIEAFFTSGNKSPQPNETAKVVKRSINRVKTSEKVSAYHQPSGLSRSRTLPDIVCPELLDESNVDKAFDDLFKSSS